MNKNFFIEFIKDIIGFFKALWYVIAFSILRNIFIILFISVIFLFINIVFN